MKGIHRRKLGHDIIDFVSDICHVEPTGTVRNTTWGLHGMKEAQHRAQNTMGYRTRRAEEPANTQTEDQPVGEKAASASTQCIIVSTYFVWIF